MLLTELANDSLELTNLLDNLRSLSKLASSFLLPSDKNIERRTC